MPELVTISVDLDGVGELIVGRGIEFTLIGGPGFYNGMQLLRQSEVLAHTDQAGVATFGVISNERITPAGTRYKFVISGNEFTMGFTNADEGTVVALGDPDHSFEVASPPPTWPSASAFVRASTKGQPDGVASLDEDGLVPSDQLPPSSGGGGSDFTTPVTVTQTLPSGFNPTSLVTLLDGATPLIELASVKLNLADLGVGEGFVHLQTILFHVEDLVTPLPDEIMGIVVGTNFDGKYKFAFRHLANNAYAVAQGAFDPDDHEAADFVTGSAYDSLDGRVTTAGTAISSLQSDLTAALDRIAAIEAQMVLKLVPPETVSGWDQDELITIVKTDNFSGVTMRPGFDLDIQFENPGAGWVFSVLLEVTPASGGEEGQYTMSQAEIGPQICVTGKSQFWTVLVIGSDTDGPSVLPNRISSQLQN